MCKITVLTDLSESFRVSVIVVQQETNAWLMWLFQILADLHSTSHVWQGTTKKSWWIRVIRWIRVVRGGLLLQSLSPIIAGDSNG